MFQKTVFLAIALFLLSVLCTLRLDGMADGYTTAGFPLQFLKYTEGKCVACDQYFRLPALLLDLTVAVLIAFGGLKAYLYMASKSRHSLL